MMQIGIEAINILRSEADRIKSPITWSRTVVTKLLSEVQKKKMSNNYLPHNLKLLLNSPPSEVASFLHSVIDT